LPPLAVGEQGTGILEGLVGTEQGPSLPADKSFFEAGLD